MVHKGDGIGPRMGSDVYFISILYDAVILL